MDLISLNLSLSLLLTFEFEILPCKLHLYFYFSNSVLNLLLLHSASDTSYCKRWLLIAPSVILCEFVFAQHHDYLFLLWFEWMVCWLFRQIFTSLKWTSCIPTSSIMDASSSMFGVTTLNAVQPCLNVPKQTNITIHIGRDRIFLKQCHLKNRHMTTARCVIMSGRKGEI